MDHEQYQNIMNELAEIKRSQKYIESFLPERLQPVSDWIPAQQAAEEFGYSIYTLSAWRRTGLIMKWKSSPGGRKIHYSRKELEKVVFLKIT